MHELLRSVVISRARKDKRDVWLLRELALALLAIVSVFVFGSAGYMAIEGWNAFDSFYMSVITLTTVGFQEVHPLSDHGRAFTIFLIFAGVGVVMSVLATLSRVILERQLRWIFERRNMRERVEKLSNHTVVCGFGRLSQIALQHLDDSDLDLVFIDNDEDKVENALELGQLILQGDATDEEVLQTAGLERARCAVVMLPKDADNLYCILACKELNKDLYIISRAEDEIGEKRMKRAGADRIISPYRVGGIKIADGLKRPHVAQFLDLAVSSSTGDLQIEEIVIPEESPVIGKSLQELDIRQRTNITIAAAI